YVASIDEEADEMTELVGNLLDMSRIEAGSMPLDPEQCHLADITGDCIKRVARSRLGGRHDITVDVALELPEVFVDYDQVCRVLSNLLSNSIKYSQPGSEITVRSYLMPSNAGRIVTEVGDSGVGIPDNEIDKIFDKFYRVTSQRGRGRPGSGLGLAICKSIIEAHDGKIWVDSTPGRGSTFYFDLPVSIPSVGI
ncbi:MAG: histidine kinase, partial [Chloroflexi bacterium]|nr:histidine kinase [Chloroflexota bacterium]